MKAAVLFLLFALCYVECRKVYAPINKNANIDFINMESGGVRAPPAAPAPTTKPPTPPVSKPAAQPAQPVAKPAVQPPPPVAKPAAPSPTLAPAKPVPTQPSKPAQDPTQIKPVPVGPAPVANPITTPGPGSVKSLINFYDSQGKASPIRPYSYSQAVKQG